MYLFDCFHGILYLMNSALKDREGEIKMCVHVCERVFVSHLPGGSRWRHHYHTDF